MSSRSRSRQRALQILFLWDARRQPIDDALDAYYDTLFPEEHPGRDAEHWRMERMPAVDRNILRLAVYEMTHEETPAPVVIDEALELARKFSNQEAVQFVNGVLDAVHREITSSA